MTFRDRLAKLGVTLNEGGGKKPSTPTSEQRNVTTLRAIVNNPSTSEAKGNEVITRLEELAEEHGVTVDHLMSNHKSYS